MRGELSLTEPDSLRPVRSTRIIRYRENIPCPYAGFSRPITGQYSGFDYFDIRTEGENDELSYPRSSYRSPELVIVLPNSICEMTEMARAAAALRGGATCSRPREKPKYDKPVIKLRFETLNYLPPALDRTVISRLPPRNDGSVSLWGSIISIFQSAVR